MSKEERPVWRFLDTGVRSAAVNMAIDEAILLAHGQGLVPPTVRFYRWQPAGLSVGYFQRAGREVDLDGIQRRGYELVRRMTGGRAVLHDQELTYSLIVREDYPGLPRTVNEAYRVLSSGLVEGFRELGLQADLMRLDGDSMTAGKSEEASPACFDSPSWYELVVEGRKIAGSAQTRQKNVVLQHGAILLELDIDALFDVLLFRSEALKQRMRASFAAKAVAINDLLRLANRPTITYEQAARVFAAGMERGMQVKLESGELTPFELETAKRLQVEKYGQDDWTFRR